MALFRHKNRNLELFYVCSRLGIGLIYIFAIQQANVAYLLNCGFDKKSAYKYIIFSCRFYFWPGKSEI